MIVKLTEIPGVPVAIPADSVVRMKANGPHTEVYFGDKHNMQVEESFDEALKIWADALIKEDRLLETFLGSIEDEDDELAHSE